MPQRVWAHDPAWAWRTLTTPHFFVHYYVSRRHDETAVAQEVAHAAERAHRKLVPLLHHQPQTRTHVVVTDDTDSANGSAYVVPYNAINVYVTAPESLSELNDYDDWLYLLVLHEYVHILHLDTIGGLPWLVNRLLGKIWAPNQVQPRWFTEGLAVYFESAQSSAGRNRSALFDMMLRTAMLQGRWLRLDQISSTTRLFPRGSVPYLYGGRFLHYIAQHYGVEALAKISHAYGQAALPYGLSRVSLAVLGKRYPALYEAFTQELRCTYEHQQRQVQARGETYSRALTHHGWQVAAPRVSIDGRELVYFADDGRKHAAWQVLDVGRWQRKERYWAHGGESASISPDGAWLVFARTNYWRTYSAYHDLYVLRRSDRQVRRLTWGLRAFDPDVSPDGRWVVFVSNELGTSTLYRVPISGGTPQVLWQAAAGGQFFAPRWRPDGQAIVLSARRSAGRRDIALFDLASRRPFWLTNDRAIDADPVFSHNGRALYFTSDRTGIFNIYRFDLLQRTLVQVTNVISGAFAPAPTADERTLVFVGYSARGYDLQTMALTPQRWLPVLPYHDRRPAPEHPDPHAPPYPSRSYQPWSTLYPRSWSLLSSSDAFGATLGAEVSAADVIGRHDYLLRVTTSLARGYTSAFASYSYHRFWPSLNVSLSRFVGQRGGLEINGVSQVYVEQNYGLSLSAGLPLLRLPEHAVSLSLSYALNRFRAADQARVLVEPTSLSPRLPELGLLSGVVFGLSYANVERYAESISAERGRSFSVQLRVDSAALGSAYENTQLSWGWTEFFSLPWSEQHVLALRYGGGIASGDFRRRGYFFVGGFPQQDVLRAIVERLPVGGAYLRGYAPGALYGDQYHLLSAEYRLPLWSIERGLSTLPVYVNYLHLTAFSDLGAAFFGPVEANAFKLGVGGELLSQWVVGFVVPLTLRVGYARGLMQEGGNRFFILVGNPF